MLWHHLVCFVDTERLEHNNEERAMLLREEALAEEEALRLASMMGELKDRLVWNPKLPKDLNLRALRAAGGRGRRTMAAACREFRALVAEGKSKGIFPREPQLCVMGGDQDGELIEACYPTSNTR